MNIFKLFGLGILSLGISSVGFATASAVGQGGGGIYWKTKVSTTPASAMFAAKKARAKKAKAAPAAAAAYGVRPLSKTNRATVIIL